MKRGFAQINLAVLLWGFTAILGKAISLSAPVLVWYRMILSAAILFLIITVRKGWPQIAKKDLRRLLLIGILFSIHWIAFYTSVKLANASIAVVCLASASVFTAVLDPVFNRRKFIKAELLLSFLAVIGVACIYVFHSDAAKGEPMVNFKLGLLSGLLASVIASLFSVLNKPLAEKYPARPLVFWEMTGGLTFLSLLAPFYIFHQPEVQLLPAGFDYLWIIILAYCCTVWAQSLAMASLKTLSAFTVTLSVNMEPVYGIILAFLIFKENNQLGYGFYIGMAFIFISIALQLGLTLRHSRRLHI
jgi:drug/metabolite transporter (DMT)-like permease